MELLWEYLDYFFMVQLMHTHTVDTRPFLSYREGPGDEAT